MSPVDAAVRFYDIQRDYATEAMARVQAEMYLRRKAEGLDRIKAAEELANALAARAAERTP